MATMTLSSTLQGATSLLAAVEVELRGAQETAAAGESACGGEAQGSEQTCSSLPAGGTPQEGGAFPLHTCPWYHGT